MKSQQNESFDNFFLLMKIKPMGIYNQNLSNKTTTKTF